MSKRWLARFPWSVLLILVLAGGVVLAQPAVEGKDPLAGDAQAAAAAPPRRYVSIWTDNLENRNPAVAYNSRHGEFLSGVGESGWRHGVDSRPARAP